MEGRHLSIPVGHADWLEKLSWLREPEFAAAQNMGIRAAIEWKGKPPTPQIVAELNDKGIYWGLHAPNNLADTAAESWERFLGYMEEAAPLKPGYMVVHGRDSYSCESVPMDDPVERYRSRISAEHYMENVLFQIKLMVEMGEIMKRWGTGKVRIENTSVTEFALVDGKFTLPTYALPRVGNWTEVWVLAEMADAETVWDMGHGGFSWNYYNRKEEYYSLPAPPVFTPRDEYETWLWTKLGIGIREGEFPTVINARSFTEAIATVHADVYHLDAATRESTPDGAHCDSHAPIRYDDQRMKAQVGFLLALEDVIISLEVDGSSGNGGPFDWRPMNNYDTQHESWGALCKIAYDWARTW